MDVFTGRILGGTDKGKLNNTHTKQVIQILLDEIPSEEFIKLLLADRVILQKQTPSGSS